jgi:peptide/nickel transport system permease protein
LQHFFLMGTDSLGRDTWSRVVYGARVSLSVGISVALLALACGGLVGVAAGYFRRLDDIIMRLMDGVMAIPRHPVRDQPGGAVRRQAAHGGGGHCGARDSARGAAGALGGAHGARGAVRGGGHCAGHAHLEDPGAPHPAKRDCAADHPGDLRVRLGDILVEAILSFLGVGLPADMATWGNIMAEGRMQFNQFPHNVLFPGIFLALTVLAVNILGDGLRDTLDPKFNKRGG